ncbi:hypothetical protein EMIHUDRAFT_112027 [Emiliania huxleyi CCMP1516]|uniref:Calcineurin-like phosphoesterase domain-containing protein n=2 Tax=Emiliania huxleyi TaxID=2903 RepID=A0A0D3KB60_EMIH1|nr:hypothetical protein EMIHUDRAFT_112027 [Emiliania huxleyi CCMP1516]EOD32995.1 hypothetical protein EMIHUDRAFT_112027 [Emiliania huxleyi CCMP1516]|eukprot:XP_005785424.1 hypothetical protein EMIHUDRAFT_112027 [Emiliania huxleyi CCMP1516]
MLALSALLPAYSHPSSVCAVGDLHGDLQHALAALALCGAVDPETGSWVGGAMTVVQTGDVLDRGNNSLGVLRALWRLQAEAEAAGGELVLLLGNHELMNMQGKVHYVHKAELAAEGGAGAWKRRMQPTVGDLGAALLRHDAAAVRGGGACRTLFVHAGVRLSVAERFGSVERLNEAVGHNIVPWVSSRCGGTLALLDVGMSSAYGGLPAACDVGEEGEARTAALYYHGAATRGPVRSVSPPPELCDACSRFTPAGGGGDRAEAARQENAAHDCHEYCPPERMEL